LRFFLLQKPPDLIARMQNILRDFHGSAQLAAQIASFRVG
jgi:hypothetical protein